jgi:hypothetical protein
LSYKALDCQCAAQASGLILYTDFMIDFSQTVKQQAGLAESRSFSAQQRLYIPTAAQNTQNQNIFIFNPVKNNVISDRKTP